MKLNRRRGAALGMVAVCVLVIIVLGICFFVLSQILGGGREIANATDAGVLNVAREALNDTTVNVPLRADNGSTFYSDFIGFDESAPAGDVGSATTGRGIDMLGINRVIAQAAIVALNASRLNTPESGANATAVMRAAQDISRDLRDLLTNNNSYLEGQFANVAQRNNTKFFQGNTAELDGAIRSGYTRVGLSANVFFSPALTTAVEVSLPSRFLNTRTGALRDASGAAYMAGYVPHTIGVNGGSVTIAGVPIFPQQRPHLIDLGEFNGHTANPNGLDYTPPNAFRANSRTLNNQTNSFGAAIACAVVGALDRGFTARLPRGYVRFINDPDANSVPGNVPLAPVVDGTHDVFNNELWAPNDGVFVSSNGAFALSAAQSGGRGLQDLNNWIDYNNNPGNWPNGEPPAPAEHGNPPDNPDGVYMPTPSGSYRLATANDMKGLFNGLRATGSTQCTHLNIFQQANNCLAPDPATGGQRNYRSGTVGDVVHALQSLTGANNQGGQVSTDGGITAVNYQKLDLLTDRARGAECSTVNRVNRSGMEKFNIRGCYVGTHNDSDFGVPGSPLDYLNQIAGGSGAIPPGGYNTTGRNLGSTNCREDMLRAIFRRVQQIDPNITNRAVLESALGSQELRLGQTLFLYSPYPGNLQLVAGTPGAYFNRNLANDGSSHGAQSFPPASLALPFECQNSYGLANRIVNATKNGQPGSECQAVGDANYHQAPFTSYRGGTLQGHDKAIYTPASGFRNVLGDIRFVNEANDTGTFCTPN